MSFKFKIPEGGERQCARPQPGAKRGNQPNRQKKQEPARLCNIWKVPVEQKNTAAPLFRAAVLAFLCGFVLKSLYLFFFNLILPYMTGNQAYPVLFPPILVIGKIIQLQMVKHGSSTCQLRVASRPVFTISVALSRFKAITNLTDCFYMVCAS